MLKKKYILRMLLERLTPVKGAESWNRDLEEVDVMLQELAEYVQNRQQLPTREALSEPSAAATAGSVPQDIGTDRKLHMAQLQLGIDELKSQFTHRRRRATARDTDMPDTKNAGRRRRPRLSTRQMISV